MRPEGWGAVAAMLAAGFVAVAPGCGGAPEAQAPSSAAPAAASRDASTPGAPAGPEDARLQKVLDTFVARYLERAPVEATQLGDHTRDGAWPDWSQAGVDATAQLYAETRAELAAIGQEGLSLEAKVDAHTVAHSLAYLLFRLRDERRHETDPLLYTALLGDGLDPLVTRSFAPLADRVTSLTARLAGIPAVVATAKANLRRAPKLHTETAIRQTAGLIAFVRGPVKAAAAPLPDKQAALAKAADDAAKALEELRTYLQKELLPKAKDEFRLGRALYEKKLRFELDSDIGVDALADEARTLLGETHEQMFDTAVAVWGELGVPASAPPKTAPPAEKKAFVRKTLAKLAEDRPDNRTIVDEAKKLLVDTTAFVRAKNLVRVPDEPCDVIEMPEYKRGVAIAYCDSTGPLEKKHEAVYAIAPTPKEWPPKRVTSFYQEYNRSMLADLTIHEAMPGHYLQGMHAVRAPRVARAIFSNGPYVEGWAVYAEWLMAQHGYGGAKVRIQREKMLLRLLANAIVDHDTHAGAMTEKEALALMMNEAFQEEGEAVAKWTRARLTSAQLSTYFYGFREMMRLRRLAEARAGFQERAYNDEVLAHGAPSMRSLETILQATYFAGRR